MLVKDWLSVVSNAPNIKVVDGNTWAYGTKESIEENYGDFDLKEVEQPYDDTGLLTLYVSQFIKCDCYRTRIVKHYLSEYEKGYYAALHGGIHIEYTDKEEPYCFGTKSCEVCHCGGNKEKCDHLVK